MSFSKNIQLQLLNFLFKDQTMIPPSQVYIGLSSTLPLFDGSGVSEPQDPVYARQMSNFAQWAVNSEVSVPFIYNTVEITFALAEQDWLAGEELRYVVFFNNSVGSEYFLYGELLQPKSIYTADLFSFPAAHLEIIL